MDAAAALDISSLRDKARRTASAVPRPFVRWAGSKQRLLTQLVEVLPEKFGCYYEPFLGGGSLFFLLEPSEATLGDSSQRLIETYLAIRDNPARVLAHLSKLDPLSREEFYAVRSCQYRGRYERASQFIYLNKAGWNGLYRVNSKGVFNVPYGQPKSRGLANPKNIFACASLLAKPNIRLVVGDFEATTETAKEGDLVFFDPPYVTGHNDNGFVDYNEILFSWSDQIRLAMTAESLARKGVYVVVTNACHEGVLNLYSSFEWRPIHRNSTLAGDLGARKPVKEALLWKRP